MFRPNFGYFQASGQPAIYNTLGYKHIMLYIIRVR